MKRINRRKILLISIFIFCFLVISPYCFATSYPPEPLPSHSISSAEDFKKIGTEWPLNEVFFLESDIYLDNEEWICIGNSDSPFTGMFEGSGYSIVFKNEVSFNQTLDSANNTNGYGFFGNIGQSAIFNLTLVFNENITNSNCENLGAFVGVMENSTEINYNGSVIKNCSVIGNGAIIFGENNVGGFAGTVLQGTIENCTSDMIAVSDGEYAGGFIGYIQEGNISNCTAAGASKSNNSENMFIGGINENYGHIEFNNSYNINEYLPIPPEYPSVENSGGYRKYPVILIGAILLVLIVVFGTFWYFKNRKNRKNQ